MQMVRYYGWFSNVCRGNRQKEKTDTAIPAIIEADETSPAKRKAWARLIQKIYEVDPLTCPKCKGAMKILSFIDQPECYQSDTSAYRAVGKKKPPAAKDQSPHHQTVMRSIKSPHTAHAGPDYPFEAYL